MKAAEILWVRDGDRVVIVSDGGEHACVLKKAEAAAWEWWADGEDLESVVRGVAVCWSVEVEELRNRMLELMSALLHGDTAGCEGER